MMTGGNRKDARNLFEKMSECVEVPWRSHKDMGFVCLRKGEVTRMNGYPLALSRACSISAASEQGKQIHSHATYAGLYSILSVSSALVDMSAKCDSIEDSCLDLDNLLEPNLVSWKTVIVAYTQHQHGMKVFELFDQMRDYVTFISVLSVGLLYIGYAYFTSTNEDNGVTPRMDYCTCTVGLLGWAGQLTDAETLIKEMPFSLYIVVWPTLPAACTILGNPEFGALMAQRIFELDPRDDISYGMLLANYVGVGILDESAEVRKLISDRRAKREPGCSWIKTNDKPHLFMVGDPSIPQMDEMHVTLERLTEEIEEAGYMPDTNYMLHIVEMDKKESYLTYHSKKLAIAFWLINTSAVIPLKIKKFFHVWVIAILPSSCLQDCCARNCFEGQQLIPSLLRIKNVFWALLMMIVGQTMSGFLFLWASRYFSSWSDTTS